MGFLDQISKTISQGVDRAKFEAEKFQRTTRIQGELNDLRRQVNEKLIELGQRAYDLQRSGQINSATIADLSRQVDQLHSQAVNKEEELKQAQSDMYIEPAVPPSPPPSQSVPINYETPTPQPPPRPAASPPATKACPSCSFQMPGTAMFCPNCGARVPG